MKNMVKYIWKITTPWTAGLTKMHDLTAQDTKFHICQTPRSRFLQITSEIFDKLCKTNIHSKIWTILHHLEEKYSFFDKKWARNNFLLFEISNMSIDMGSGIVQCRWNVLQKCKKDKCTRPKCFLACLGP